MNSTGLNKNLDIGCTHLTYVFYILTQMHVFCTMPEKGSEKIIQKSRFFTL